MLTQSDITDETGTSRIYGLRERPPAGYRPTDGKAICLKPRPYRQDYSRVVHKPSYMFTFWAETELLAWNLYRTFHGVADGARPSGSFVQQINLDLAGEPIVEEREGVNWYFTLAFYEVQFKDCS